MTRRSGVRLAVLVMSLLLPAHSSAGYEAVTVTDGGTVQGKVVYTAAKPTPRKVVHSKDSEVCGSGVRDVEQIVVAADKAVQDAVVFLRSVERGKPWPAPVTPPAVRNLACEFTPSVQVIRVGSRLELVNADPVFHNVQASRDRTSLFNLSLIKLGRKVSPAFDQAGIVRLECSAHGWMRGWVYVADNPYYAVTSKDGTFAIRDVPPGRYTLVTWHPYSGEVETPVTVTAGNTAAVTPDLARR